MNNFPHLSCKVRPLNPTAHLVAVAAMHAETDGPAPQQTETQMAITDSINGHDGAQRNRLLHFT